VRILLATSHAPVLYTESFVSFAIPQVQTSRSGANINGHHLHTDTQTHRQNHSLKCTHERTNHVSIFNVRFNQGRWHLATNSLKKWLSSISQQIMLTSLKFIKLTKFTLGLKHLPYQFEKILRAMQDDKRNGTQQHEGINQTRLIHSVQISKSADISLITRRPNKRIQKSKNRF